MHATTTIEGAIHDIAISVMDGTRSPEHAYAELYRIKNAVEDAMKSVKEEAITVVKRYGKDGFVTDDMKITVRNAAGRWDFSGVTSHASMRERLKVIETLAKAAAQTGAPVVDAATGETIEPATYTEGSETLNVTSK